MRKIRLSGDEGENTVFSEISGCGYVTVNDNVALPN